MNLLDQKQIIIKFTILLLQFLGPKHGRWERNLILEKKMRYIMLIVFVKKCIYIIFKVYKSVSKEIIK